ncbi:ferritin heavy chain-like [Styela clava]
MKNVLAILLLSMLGVAFGGECKGVFKCYDDRVNKWVNSQIGVELSGHYTYLYLAQIFEHHTRHYPKVAKYLRAKSAEELSHAERFIEYQNQRGGTVDMPTVSRYTEGSCADVKDIKTAFKCAMELEAHVTRQLTQLHNDASEVKKEFSNQCSGVDDIDDDDLRLTQPLLITCTVGENSATTTSTMNVCTCDSIQSIQYVELAEMIAHEFLGHQVEDTKEIANHYRNVLKLQSADGAPGLGDFIFDKHLEL